VVLEKGLGVTKEPKDRRREVIRKVMESPLVPKHVKLKSPVDLVREDRER